ncbi:MAG: hypothetical protein PUP92_39245 [Rhizonema sp. PD38]|nr:hypothetical protein [Rhizonema sp. PD38]
MRSPEISAHHSSQGIAQGLTKFCGRRLSGCGAVRLKSNFFSDPDITHAPRNRVQANPTTDNLALLNPTPLALSGKTRPKHCLPNVLGGLRRASSRCNLR